MNLSGSYGKTFAIVTQNNALSRAWMQWTGHLCSLLPAAVRPVQQLWILAR